MRVLNYIIIISIVLTSHSFAQSPYLSGTLKGKIVDIDSKLPIAGANLHLLESEFGASTDLDGNYVIFHVPVGSYALQCSYLGYAPVVKADIIIRPDRITTLQIELKATTIRAKEVTVRSSFFRVPDKQPTSSMSMSQEEIRRAAGSAGDVSRIIMGLPSVAKVNDTRNSLVVRGGSPVENGYYVDGIAVPNINHFPTQGASGGAIGLLNVDFIKEVSFLTGGFSTAYGDKLSSVMDISLREGNSSEFDGQADINFTGFGVVGEGPLKSTNGAWLFSARRSYFDLIIESFDVEASAVPETADIQGKATWNINNMHKLTLFEMAGFGGSRIEKQWAIDNGENLYGEGTYALSTTGLSWRWLWGGLGYSTTSLSYTNQQWDGDWFKAVNDAVLTEKNSSEEEITFRNSSHIIFDPRSELDFGGEIRIISNRYDDLYGASIGPLGNAIPQLTVDNDFSSSKYAIFSSSKRSLSEKLTVTPGLRLDHFAYNDNTHLSPRLQLSFNLDDGTTISASSGRFYQFLPLTLLAQKEVFKDLKDPYADHFVVSFSRLLRNDTRLTLEAYTKEYRNFPLDPLQPSLFIIDESNSEYGISNHDSLYDSGEAYARGVEIMLQKKLAQDFYGLISGSYYRARYKGLDGEWRNRRYDNQYMFAVEGGYKPSNRWEYSIRWVYAGGAPHTPYDLTASNTANSGVFDKEKINEARLPDYHSMDLRVDRRFHFQHSNLIAYLSIWNVYGRKNLSGYYWNEIDNQPDELLQWGTLPVFGMEWEF